MVFWYISRQASVVHSWLPTMIFSAYSISRLIFLLWYLSPISRISSRSSEQNRLRSIPMISKTHAAKSASFFLCQRQRVEPVAKGLLRWGDAVQAISNHFLSNGERVCVSRDISIGECAERGMVAFGSSLAVCCTLIVPWYFVYQSILRQRVVKREVWRAVYETGKAFPADIQVRCVQAPCNGKELLFLDHTMNLIIWVFKFRKRFPQRFCCIDYNIIPFLPTALDYLAQIFRFRRFCLPRINAIPTETEWGNPL